MISTTSRSRTTTTTETTTSSQREERTRDSKPPDRPQLFPALLPRPADPAPRSALFGAADLEEPNAEASDDEDFDRESDDEEAELEDDFGLGEDDEGVTLDEFDMDEDVCVSLPSASRCIAQLTISYLVRPETELVMSGKAAKRAARKVYNSDDEGDAPVVDAGVPEPVEGQEEDATMSELDAESDDDLEEGVLTDLRAVERRMRTSARVLGNWKEFGASSGKWVLPFSPVRLVLSSSMVGLVRISSNSSLATSVNITATPPSSPRNSSTFSESTR